MTAVQYAFPAARPGWRHYCIHGLARDDYRISRERNGHYLAYRMHADMTSTQLGTFDTLDAAADYIESEVIR